MGSKHVDKEVDIAPQPRGGELHLLKKGSERAKEIGRLGGRSRSVRKYLANRKLCNSKCKLQDRCVLVTIGRAANACAVNALEDPVRAAKLVRFFSATRESLKEEISVQLAEISELSVDLDIKERLMVLDRIMAAHKTLFGEDSKTQIVANNIVFQWNIEGEEREEKVVKEVKRNV